MLPTELNDNNGKLLQDCVTKYAENWGLEQGFLNWLSQSCRFVDTLVDRIVVGYPEDPLIRFRLNWAMKMPSSTRPNLFPCGSFGDSTLGRPPAVKIE